MSRLPVPNLESDIGPSGEVYAQIKKAIGSVPKTFAAIAAHGPAALKSVLAVDAVLAGGTLTKRDQEVIKLAISAAAGCGYCVAAHNYLAQLAGVKPDALKQIREGQRHDYAFHHCSKSAYPHAAPVRPACGGSRLSRRPGLDGDHVLLLRLPEVVSVRVRKTGPVHQQWAADLVAVSGLWPRRREPLPRRLGVDLRVAAACRFLGQAAGRSWRPRIDRHLHRDVTIIPFMPEGWDIAAGGFPAMTGNVPFLMKDVVLLAVSLYLLRQDVVRLTQQ
jgi:AhpD family alkylhydroperoxidase